VLHEYLRIRHAHREFLAALVISLVVFRSIRVRGSIDECATCESLPASPYPTQQLSWQESRSQRGVHYS
jgi:hypothetical protein